MQQLDEIEIALRTQRALEASMNLAQLALGLALAEPRRPSPPQASPKPRPRAASLTINTLNGK